MPFVGWTAFAIFLVSGMYAHLGGKPGVTTIELNPLSHTCLALWTLIVSALLVLFYRHESNAVTGIFALVESRKRNRRKWILSGAIAVPATAAVAWLAAYGGLSRINTNLSGPETRQEAIVAGVYHYNYAWKCRDIEVRLKNGIEHGICVERGFFGGTVPINAACAAVGDVVEVAETRTALGKTLTLLSIDAPRC